MDDDPRVVLRRHLRPGMRVAVGDGAGMPMSLLDPLAEVAAEVGDISLLLGWCLQEPFTSEPDAFSDIRAFMGGFGLGPWITSGLVNYVPCRLRGIPALVAGPLRPDVLLLSLRRSDRGWEWGTEVSWMAAALDQSPILIVEHNSALPRTTAQPAVPIDDVTVASSVHRSPLVLPAAPVTEAARSVARNLLPWIPEGSRVQLGPGPIAQALVDQLDRPIHVHTGMLTDCVVTLDERGLLLGDPMTTYVSGEPGLYLWADGRSITHRVETTHRLPDVPPLIAINSALEIDELGQVNVQGSPRRQISGMGGHPDFAMLGAISAGGLSVIAIPSDRGPHSTLVEGLSGPVSTPRIDVDVVVTDRGSADLRGRTDDERRRMLWELWA